MPEPAKTYDLPSNTGIGSPKPSDYDHVRIGPDETPPKERDTRFDDENGVND